ncbi:NADH-quinone oxidoreductase subunit NuoH [bacterium]|nr:NADH-quinone oxidoreductase subunit NuoH [bacterium]MBU1025124.1 NADH-quinone oxidoreductase subunit NuoH [bacterium]
MYYSIDYIDVLIILLKVAVAAVVLILAAAYMTYAERKVVARIQVRVGPNRCGPFGLVQPIADAVKLMFKEDIAPRNVDKFLWALAPILTVGIALTAFSIIPMGEWVTVGGREFFLGIADVNVGILIFLALSSIAVYGIVLGGWASGSNYSLLGSMRAGAQMISYELSMAISVVTICLWAGSLNLSDIVKAQMNMPVTELLNFILMLIPHVIALVIFIITILAETNRAPFDLPECESELVAGFHTEYSGLRFAMFFLGEYVNIIVGSAIMVTLFLGGWMLPFGLSNTIVQASPLAGHLIGIIWFLVKLAIVLFCFIWVRATFPRFRYDQLMAFGWKVLFPIALANLFLMAFIKLLISG